MANLDDDLDKTEDEISGGVNKKKILMIVIPTIVVIGLLVSFYYVFSQKLSSTKAVPYSVVSKTPGSDGKAPDSVLVFYDLPEINVQLKNTDRSPENVKMKLSIELDNVADVKFIEGMMPKITDIIISHTVELTPDEISGANGLYWLKEELLHRINLVTAPVKIANINFKNFEIQKDSKKE